MHNIQTIFQLEAVFKLGCVGGSDWLGLGHMGRFTVSCLKMEITALEYIGLKPVIKGKARRKGS